MKLTHQATLLLVTLSLIFAAVGPASAQTGEPETTTEAAETGTTSTEPDRSSPTSGSDRMFLNFAEDAAIVDGQWWEGQVVYQSGDDIDRSLLQGVAAFQPWRHWELGGRFGFGSSSTSAGLPDGTGATDFDAWAKYAIQIDSPNTEFAVGSLLTIPTGDDRAGLGTDAFALGLFAGVRHRLQKMIVVVDGGFQFNDDAQFLGLVKADGKTSMRLGGGIIAPISDKLNVVAEAVFESKRFEGGDSDVRVLGGFNWRAFRRGMARTAIAFGDGDATPDFQFLMSYAATF